MGVIAGVERLATMGEAIKRRHRKVEVALIDQPRHLPVEERDQQRCDMRAVDVGIGHDDDAGVAQILLAVMRAGAAADRLHQVGKLRIGGELVLGGGRDVEDLAAQRQDSLGLAVARLLGAAAGRVTLDDEQLRAFRGGIGAVGELAGETQPARQCAGPRRWRGGPWSGPGIPARARTPTASRRRRP